MRAPLVSLAGALALATASLPAIAHDGHVHDGLVAGLAHPIGGADHLLATLGIGLLAGLASTVRRQAGAGGPAGLSRIGLAGALGLLAGAVWALLAGTVPGLPAVSGGIVEPAAAVGLLAVALALLQAERLGAGGLAAVALAIALPHGWLHASEGSGAAFFIGLAVSSALLFALGAVAARRSARTGDARATVVRGVAAAGYVGAFAWTMLAV
ncbi:MAG: urease accessory protein UreJ [Burkholderiales bacterium]|nr:MAG: urease accessory protein UreJ [Burkholderiales bacterium]